MQMMTTPQRPVYKGNPHLRVRPHVGVIALGNAIGNSIVSGMQKKQTQANVDKATQVGNEVYEREISLGKSPKQAKFAAAQAIAKSSGGAVSLNETSDSALLPSHGTSNPDATSGFYLSSGSEQGFIHYDASMNDVAEFLAGSSAYDLGMSHASQMFGIKQSADIAFKNGVAEGIHNVRAATANRIANAKGFNANHMTANQWQGIVNNKTRQWGSELQSDVMDIVAAPLALTGFGYAGMRLIGSGALKLAQGAFRGNMIHGSSKLAVAKTMVYGGAQIGAGKFLIDSGVNFAENSLTGSNNAINDIHRTGQHIYHEAKRNGGITQAVGFTIGGEAFGVKADVAFGGYYSNDFNRNEVKAGPYISGEFGGNLTLPMGMPSWGAGFEATTFTTDNWRAAMRDSYGIFGGDIGKGNKAINVNYVRPIGTGINGYQSTLQLWGSSTDGYSANGMSKYGWGWAW
ncbi:hypothetical protein [Pseudoalteromonas sp. MMG022]|uniref:hypothetical protein n=1 Tax=Pseudoalteromonas sp. MMG022 TaxID=2909978 RepID=UPI001F37217B|nr:hypothetical protein [Pseudoalteromonas sp. MMG022]MCF6437009.1 hypothetical protein [Pseudoalteromonas sp. MMG022]